MTVIYIDDFVIVKTYGKKPYSVSKKSNINNNYPYLEFKTYKQVIDFINKRSKTSG